MVTMPSLSISTVGQEYTTPTRGSEAQCDGDSTHLVQFGSAFGGRHGCTRSSFIGTSLHPKGQSAAAESSFGSHITQGLQPPH